MTLGTPPNPDPGLPAPGQVLAGKYRIERLLGKGGMGVVFAAHHELLGVPVAVKLLLTEIAESPEQVTRFLNEARNAARIQSDNVARVMDVGTLENGRPFMVIEYLDGEDLARVLETRGPLPLQEAVDYALQALEALAQAHVMGIVHRDLKPANLFLVRRQDRTTQVKVLDFGISKSANVLGQAGQMTSTKEMLGSPYYMSPEQLRSSKRVDARADIWSMGIILFELLAGTPPFLGETFGELFAAILEQDAPPLQSKRPDLPAAFGAVVSRCLRRNVDERFPTVGDLAAALAPFASPRGQRTAQRIHDVMPPGAANPAPWSASGENAIASTMIAPSSNPNLPLDANARAITPAPGAQTNGSWGGQVSSPSVKRSSSSVAIISGGATMVIGLVVVGAFFGWRHFTAAPTAPDPVTTASSVMSAAPPPSAASAVPVASAATSASASPPPSATGATSAAATTVKTTTTSRASHTTTTTTRTGGGGGGGGATGGGGGGAVYDPTKDSRR